MFFDETINANIFSGTPTRNQNRMSPTLGEARGDISDRQFVVLASEKQARVVALPSQTCIYRQQLADTDFVVKAETISIKGKILFMANIKYGLFPVLN